ncbi:MAG: YihY/virulence factor BrkB family protein [Frankiaceae bacterium]
MRTVRLVERIDGYQRRHSWLGFPLAVIYKFFDDQGNLLSAMIAYYGFLSLFPLMLLLTTALGFVLHDNAHLQAQVVQSALAQFPVIGDQLRTNIKALHGSGTALVVGILGTVYGGLGIAQAVQNAFNKVWAVPRNERPNPVLSRLRGLLLLLVIGLGVLATTVLSALSTGAKAYGADLGGGARIAATVLSIVVNGLLLMLAFRVATARDISTKDIRVGAVTAAIAWQLLQMIGTYYLGHKLRGATQVYGLFGIVLGLLAWIYLEALILVFCTEINVVRRDGLWPRALLTPLTDDVDLTSADKEAYASYAAAERFKGNEEVEVSFNDRGNDGTASEPPAESPPASR